MLILAKQLLNNLFTSMCTEVCHLGLYDTRVVIAVIGYVLNPAFVSDNIDQILNITFLFNEW